MCRLKSAIILQDRVYIPDHDGHSDMLDELGIADTQQNAEKLFVRAELTPKDIFDPVDNWTYIVDQDILPDWYVAEYDKQRMIDAVKEWAKNHIHQNVSNLKITGDTHYCKNCTNLIIDGGTAKIYDGTANIYDGTAYIYDDGTAYISGGTAYISGGTADISGGTAYIHDGTAYIHGGTAYIYYGGKAYIYDDGTANIYGGTAYIYDGGTANIHGGKAYIYDGGTANIHGGKAYIYDGTANIRGGTAKIYDGTANIYDGTVEIYDGVGIIPTVSSVDISNITLYDNATLKDCRTKMIYQSGDWQYKQVDNRGDNNGD